jgi:hypothetical protein
VAALVALWAGSAAVGAVLSRRLARGDESSSELRVAAICWGRDLNARAEGLRSIEAIAVMGGIDLDLTAATPAREGASLDVLAVMGGVDVTVPHTWRVQVEDNAAAGGVEISVTDDGDLPADAPRLDVRVRAYFGGVRVAAAAR